MKDSDIMFEAAGIFKRKCKRHGLVFKLVYKLLMDLGAELWAEERDFSKEHG